MHGLRVSIQTHATFIEGNLAISVILQNRMTKSKDKSSCSITDIAKLPSIAHRLFGNFHNMNVDNFLTISLEIGHLGSYKIFLLQIRNISFKVYSC